MITLPSEIDVINADRIGAELKCRLWPGVDMVIADMSATRFCDTSGIYALVTAYKRARRSRRVNGELDG